MNENKAVGGSETETLVIGSSSLELKILTATSTSLTDPVRGVSKVC